MKENKNKVLLAGATGYLGEYILKELLAKDFSVRAIVRNEKNISKYRGQQHLEIVKAEITQSGSLRGLCKDMDAVISTVGITRQKDGLTYMDVDYQANMNLLEEAKKNGVRRFIYIALLNGEKLTRLKLCAAKEKFVNALKKSGLEYVVIRPTGYFSDMSEFFDMAKKGRIYLFGNGEYKMNPIDGADLAKVCVYAIHSSKTEISVGGPEILSHNQIAETAFSVLNKKTKITHLPGWVSQFVLFILRTFTTSKTYGPIEFLITVLSMDMIAPRYGEHTLKGYFETLVSCSGVVGSLIC